MKEKIWVVRPGDGPTLADVVRRAGADSEAVEAGRVFIGRRRARRADAPVRPGETVRIGPPPTVPSAPIEILFERDGLVACIKPAGIPTVPDHGGGAHALVSLVAARVGKRADELVVTSRLDRDVSGVVVFALDTAAGERLRSARAEGRYHRRYVAIAAGPLPPAGTWTAPIGRAHDPRLRIAGGNAPDAKEATTTFRRVAEANSTYGLLAVEPITGRTHQIRVHASDAGAPLVGDGAYGGPRRIVLANGAALTIPRIALHAARVTVPGAEAVAPIPDDLITLWRSLGGESEAWRDALERW